MSKANAAPLNLDAFVEYTREQKMKMFKLGLFCEEGNLLQKTHIKNSKSLLVQQIRIQGRLANQ